MLNPEPILKLITTPFGSVPGWAFLLVTSFWFVDTGYPQKLALELVGIGEAEIPKTAWALGLTLIFYKVGDWLDNIVYKKRVKKEPTSDKKEYIICDRFNPAWVDRQRSIARCALNIQGGSYRVAMKTLGAAEKSTAVQFANELAKFLRSLVVPFLLMAIFSLWATSLRERGLLVAFALSALVFYVLLKQFHIWLLYRQVAELTKDSRYRNDKQGEFIQFSWDGEVFITANPNKVDLCQRRESSNRGE